MDSLLHYSTTDELHHLTAWFNHWHTALHLPFSLVSPLLGILRLSIWQPGRALCPSQPVPPWKILLDVLLYPVASILPCLLVKPKDQTVVASSSLASSLPKS